MKKTVIYIGGFRLPDKNAAAPRVLNNAKILREIGYDVIFIDVADDVSEDILNTKHDIMGFKCYTIKYPKGIEWYRYLTSVKELLKVIKAEGKPDAIVVYNYQSAAFAKVLRYCKNNGIKLVADCTEWYAKSKNPIKNIDTDYRMHKLQTKADGVIAISRYLYEFYKSHTDTVYLPPLVDCNDKKWKNEYKTDDKIIFTYAGSPGRSKDQVNLFVESLYEIKAEVCYEMNVIGITEAQYLHDYPEHETIVKSLGDKLNFKGRLSHMEVLENLKNSTFSVFVRENNLQNTAGFPTKFVEAVSVGVPVMTNATSDLQDYLVDMDNCVLIESCKKEDVRNALERALSISGAEYTAMRKKCSDMKKTFHYEKYIDEMKKIF